MKVSYATHWKQSRQGGHKGQIMLGEKIMWLYHHITLQLVSLHSLFSFFEYMFILIPYLWRTTRKWPCDIMWLSLCCASFQLHATSLIDDVDNKMSFHALHLLVAYVQTCSTTKANPSCRRSGSLLPWPQHSQNFNTINLYYFFYYKYWDLWSLVWLGYFCCVEPLITKTKKKVVNTELIN